MNIERTLESTKLVINMCNNVGKITTNQGHELFMEGNEPVLNFKGEHYVLSSKIYPLIKLVDRWKVLGYAPVLNKESKLYNGKKSKCGKFTLNIDDMSAGVSAQFSDGKSKLVYLESVKNENNIIKDLENLFNFRFDIHEPVKPMNSAEIREMYNSVKNK